MAELVKRTAAKSSSGRNLTDERSKQPAGLYEKRNHTASRCLMGGLEDGETNGAYNSQPVSLEAVPHLPGTGID